jgi:mono/diheme cytochrome c family protein
MKKTVFVFFCFLGICLFYFSKHQIVRTPSYTDTELLTLDGPGFSKSFSKDELLRMQGLKSLVVAKDPAYQGKQMIYMAIPVAKLFEGIDLREVSTLNFKCLDGFSGPIDKQRLLNQSASGAIAYIAIELHQQKWPSLKAPGSSSAGPFYLIWEHPERSKIMTEEWPYQLAGFIASNVPLHVQFPHTTPEHTASGTIREGHQKFMTNCFVCHAMNGDGGAKIGPDLNLPFSATEYLNEKYFKLLVRNPQALRKWAGARMNGFDASSLSEKDLDSIWHYLGHMAKKKNSHQSN